MPDLTGASILISGANGFVGAHLVARLGALGANVMAMVRPEADCGRFEVLGVSPRRVFADMTDFDRVAKIAQDLRPAYVFNLATSRGSATWHEAMQVNCTGAVNLMEAAASPQLRRFVVLGSSLEVPRPPTNLPQSRHGASKAAGRVAMQALAAAQNIPFSALRSYYVYGPLQPRARLIPAAIRAARQRAALPVTDDKIRKHFVHVSDVVDGLIQVLDRPANPCRVYDMPSDGEVTVVDAVSVLSKLMEEGVSIKPNAFTPRQWDRSSWDLPGDADDVLPGWSPRVGLEPGLASCIDDPWSTS